MMRQVALAAVNVLQPHLTRAFSSHMPEFTIDITDHLTSPLVEHAFLKCVIHRVLVEEQVDIATISLALVSDCEIHRLNRQFLGHDYPTDVISFLLDESPEMASAADFDSGHRASGDSPMSDSLKSSVKINGELIVSTDTAIREASAHGWSPDAELLLYLVHGLLHLCGYDDLTDEARPVMRSRERELLAIWGFCPTGLEP